jgi:hypothetical protein
MVMTVDMGTAESTLFNTLLGMLGERLMDPSRFVSSQLLSIE